VNTSRFLTFSVRSRVFLVHAEDDGLLESVAAFLQEVGDLLGGEFGAVV
jgi:hypothetical protein